LSLGVRLAFLGITLILWAGVFFLTPPPESLKGTYAVRAEFSAPVVLYRPLTNSLSSLSNRSNELPIIDARCNIFYPVRHSSTTLIVYYKGLGGRCEPGEGEIIRYPPLPIGAVLLIVLSIVLLFGAIFYKE